jgi:hypothetical protein
VVMGGNGSGRCRHGGSHKGEEYQARHCLHEDRRRLEMIDSYCGRHSDFKVDNR